MESQGHSPTVKKIDEEEDKGYEAKLHAYAIRMLAELEDAQKEVRVPTLLCWGRRADMY